MKTAVAAPDPDEPAWNVTPITAENISAQTITSQTISGRSFTASGIRGGFITYSSLQANSITSLNFRPPHTEP